MKGKGIIIGIVAVILVVVIAAVSSYNGLVSARENVTNSYANIDTQLQRRGDLIPNLVNSVKGYMDHETEAIQAITDAREKLINATSREEVASADNELSAALNSFNVIVENYPDLKANTTFVQLQDELAGTENRIATARRDYNEVVRSYNVRIKRFPGALFAKMFGFEEEPYFEAEESKKDAVEVEF